MKVEYVALIVAALLILGLIAGCGAVQEKVTGSLETGNDLFSEEEFQDADLDELDTLVSDLDDLPI